MNIMEELFGERPTRRRIQDVSACGPMPAQPRVGEGAHTPYFKPIAGQWKWRCQNGAWRKVRLDYTGSSAQDQSGG